MSQVKKLPRPTTILWDMDGTLIDQSTAILRCYSEVITSLGYPPPDADIIRRSLGGPMASTMALFVESDHLHAACTAFRTRFPQIMFDGMILLPGGMEFIQRAHKACIPQVIFTNKHGETARQISRYAGFAQYIPTCIGSADTKWNKPDVLLTEHVIDRIHGTKEGAVIIGDSPTDVAVAKNAGLSAYCVATGAHSIEELTKAGAAAAFESLTKLNQNISI